MLRYALGNATPHDPGARQTVREDLGRGLTRGFQGVKARARNSVVYHSTAVQLDQSRVVHVRHSEVDMGRRSRSQEEQPHVRVGAMASRACQRSSFCEPRSVVLGFGSPRKGEGDHRDLSTGMSSGAVVGSPRLKCRERESGWLHWTFCCQADL